MKASRTSPSPCRTWSAPPPPPRRPRSRARRGSRSGRRPSWSWSGESTRCRPPVRTWSGSVFCDMAGISKWGYHVLPTHWHRYGMHPSCHLLCMHPSDSSHRYFASHSPLPPAGRVTAGGAGGGRRLEQRLPGVVRWPHFENAARAAWLSHWLKLQVGRVF